MQNAYNKPKQMYSLLPRTWNKLNKTIHNPPPLISGFAIWDLTKSTWDLKFMSHQVPWDLGLKKPTETLIVASKNYWAKLERPRSENTPRRRKRFSHAHIQICQLMSYPLMEMK